MERGEAAHSLILGGRPVVAWEEGRPRRGKDYDAFKAGNPDALILTASDFAQCNNIAEAVKGNALAMRVLEGRRELELAWKFGARECAGRLDVLGRDYVTELKTTVSADPFKIGYQAKRMGWFAQLAWYQDGALAGKHGAPEQAYIVAVEQGAPHAVTVFLLDNDAMDYGRRTYRTWLERLLACEASDSWPSYSQSIVSLGVPDNDVAIDFGEDAAA